MQFLQVARFPGLGEPMPRTGNWVPGIADIAGAVLRELHRVMGDPAWLEDLRRRLDQRGLTVGVTAPGSDRVVEGLVEDVGDDGALVLRMADGSLRKVLHGEITKSS